MEEGVVHYCVANMPGAVPQTSTEVLTSATLPYILGLADQGLDALKGKLTCRGVAEALGLPYTPLEEVL
jgi:alanine dehydrogenase